MSAMEQLRFQLGRPAAFLRVASSDGPDNTLDLGGVAVAEIWALVGMAALATRASAPWTITGLGTSDVGRFAAAVGLGDAIAGTSPRLPGEPQRTYRIRRISRSDNLEKVASDIASMLTASADEQERQKSVRFALVELMRNALQHSLDPKGGFVAAQRMDAGHRGYPHASLQIAVADNGVGILSSLAQTHRHLDSQEDALFAAVQPHVSGTFPPGGRGSQDNAGMGLFMLAEMAKLTAGRMLIASRGAALALGGELDERDEIQSTADIVKPGFPGTLVAFELPLDAADHAGLIEQIIRKRDERVPATGKAPWLQFGAAPPGVATFLVNHLGEDVVRARDYARLHLHPRLFRREPVAVDFRNVSVCTQSFAHALLFEAVRLSWAFQVPIYVENAEPAVRAVVRLVDDYARSA